MVTGELSGNLDARFNYWGPTTTAEMDEGDNPKDINRIHDYYENSNYNTVTYANWLSESGGDPPSNFTILGSILLTDSSGTEVLVFQPHSTLYIQVTDPDRNADSGTAETVTATVTSTTETTGETVTLTETGANTNTFMGSITLAGGAASSGDGISVSYTHLRAHET